MNRKFLLAGAGTALLAASALFGGRVLGLDDHNAGFSNTAVVSPAASEWITLKACNGKLAVFLGTPDAAPAAETGIDVAGLRAYDQRLVEKGITVGSYEELLRLLEDFGP